MPKKVEPENYKERKELIVKTTLRGSNILSLVKYCFQKDIPINTFTRKAIQEKLERDSSKTD